MAMDRRVWKNWVEEEEEEENKMKKKKKILETLK